MNNFSKSLSQDTPILITGGCGFIGANLIKYLNSLGFENIGIFEKGDWTKKWKNLIGLKYNNVLDRMEIFKSYYNKGIVINLAANSSTLSEPSLETYNDNTLYSNKLIYHCITNNIKIIHASSASIYGKSDNFHEIQGNFKPINFYAWTKLKTDEYIEKNATSINNIYSLRFFNVYGSNLEQYKGPMASVVYKWLTQKINGDNSIQLFKSLDSNYIDGAQERDFVHVDDICKVVYHCMSVDNKGGIYNVGTGATTSYLNIAKLVLKIRVVDEKLIEFIDLPPGLVNSYQYRTCADITRLRNVLEYKDNFVKIEDGIKDTYKLINT